MARLRTYGENKSGWLITFADLVTLLLALFVLIFSMSSLDSAVIQSISSSVSRDFPKKDLHRGKITAEIREVAQLIADTGQVHSHEGRIKELLFPQDLLPPGIDKGTLETSFRIEERDEGVAFVLGDNLLFDGAGSRISAGGREILVSMVPLFELLFNGADGFYPSRPGASEGAQAPVLFGEVQFIAFYAGPPIAGQPDDYAAAGRHALAVLGVFLNQGLERGRFSVSAYGADRAALEIEAPYAPLSRVEILLKTGKKAFEE